MKQTTANANGGGPKPTPRKHGASADGTYKIKGYASTDSSLPQAGCFKPTGPKSK